MTAAMWVLVLGILIGGAAIPHAQDKPRVVPKNEDARFCKTPPAAPPVEPTRPGGPERKQSRATRAFGHGVARGVPTRDVADPATIGRPPGL